MDGCGRMDRKGSCGNVNDYNGRLGSGSHDDDDSENSVFIIDGKCHFNFVKSQQDDSVFSLFDLILL